MVMTASVNQFKYVNLAKFGVIIANISCSEAVLHLKFIGKSSDVKSPSELVVQLESKVIA